MFTEKSILIGNRIPNDFFVTRGTGESDIAIHAGSYHLALRSAGIESYNIMTYSSILPKNATKINRPDNLIHGSVMECITAVCNTAQGELGTAGIIYSWLYDRKTKEKCGGIVCETTGNKEPGKIAKELELSLFELYEGYSTEYEMKDTTILTERIVPSKKFGTALVGICFVNYLIPLL